MTLCSCREIGKYNDNRKKASYKKKKKKKKKKSKKQELSRLRLQNTPTASLQRSKPSRNVCPGYDIKKSDGEVSVMLRSLENAEYPLPSLPGPLQSGLVAPDRVLCIG